MHESKDKMAGLMGSDHDDSQKEGGLADLNFASLVAACHLIEQVLEMVHGLLELKGGWVDEQGLGWAELRPGLVEVAADILKSESVLVQQYAGLEEKESGSEDPRTPEENGLAVTCYGQESSQFEGDRLKALRPEWKTQLMMSLIC